MRQVFHQICVPQFAGRRPAACQMTRWEVCRDFCRSFKNPRRKWSDDTWDTAVRSFRQFRMRDRKRDPPIDRIWHRPLAIYEQNHMSPRMTVSSWIRFNISEVSRSPNSSFVPWLTLSLWRTRNEKRTRQLLFNAIWNVLSLCNKLYTLYEHIQAKEEKLICNMQLHTCLKNNYVFSLYQLMHLIILCITILRYTIIKKWIVYEIIFHVKIYENKILNIS